MVTDLDIQNYDQTSGKITFCIRFLDLRILAPPTKCQMYKESFFFFFFTIFISQTFLCKACAGQYGDPQVNQMPEEGTNRGEVF